MTIKPVPQKRNANRHTQRGMQALETSIATDGWIGAITVAADGETFDGSARVEKIAENGMLDDSIVVDSDGTRPIVVRRVDIPTATDPRAVRLGIAANRVASLNLDWQPDVLAGIAEQGIDLGSLFTDVEWADVSMPSLPEPGAGGDEFDATPEDGPPRTKLGELWSIGGVHRLLVGDCTDAANVARLMGGERAATVVADLPYGSTGCAWDTVISFDELWSMYAEHTKADAAIVLTASQPFTSALIASRFDWFKHCWVWNKKLSGNFLQAERQPMKIHEDVCVFSRGDYHYSPQMRDGVRRLKGGNGKSKLWDMSLTGNVNSTYYPVSIIEIGNTDRVSIEHPTQKPIELFEYLLLTYSSVGDVALDNTAGSGTLLVAAHRTNRRAYLMEIAPRYADVILRRAEAEGLEVSRVDE